MNTTRMSKKQSPVIFQVAGNTAPKRAKRPRKARKQMPARKMAGPNRPRRQNRRGGVRTRNLPVSNNQKRFVIPIDEQITLVNGNTGAFSAGLLTYSLNPGNPTLFPFTSRTAQNYERYEFQSLRFEYKPSADVFADPGKQGFVAFSATDDAVQAPPSSQQIAEVFLHSPIAKSAHATSLTLTKKFMESSSKQLHFVRPNGLIPGGSDPHIYDSGQIFAWVNGQATNGQMGEFRVVGSVMLCNPVLETSTTAKPQFSVSWFQSNSTQTYNTGVGANAALAVATVNSLSITNTAGVFIPPPGNYLINFSVAAEDNTSEVFSGSVDIQKNGASVYGVGNKAIPTFRMNSVTTKADASLAGSVYVTANGTDQFTQFVTLTGAAGVLTAGSSMIFEAV